MGHRSAGEIILAANARSTASCFLNCLTALTAYLAAFHSLICAQWYLTYRAPNTTDLGISFMNVHMYKNTSVRLLNDQRHRDKLLSLFLNYVYCSFYPCSVPIE